MTFWPDDRTELLKKLWGEGLSASAIKRAIWDQLGHDVSRNGIMGKVHRLGLSGRPRRSANLGPDGKPRPRRKSGSKKPSILPKERETPVEVAPIDTRCTFLELDNSASHPTKCRWPIGDPRESSFRFCGCKTTEGRPYCAYHSRIAHGAPGQVEEADAA